MTRRALAVIIALLAPAVPAYAEHIETERTRVTARVQGEETPAVVTVGVHDRSIATLDVAPQWTFGSTRAPPAPSHRTRSISTGNHSHSPPTSTTTARASRCRPGPARERDRPAEGCTFAVMSAPGSWRANRPASSVRCPNKTDPRRSPAGSSRPLWTAYLWTLLGVTSNSVKAEIRPHVDALRIHAPGTLKSGSTETVAATVKQGSRTVPVRYPIGAVWEGSRGLHVGAEDGIREWHVAWLEPDNGVLTGIRPGQAQISVTVNGVTSSTDVHVSPRGTS